MTGYYTYKGKAVKYSKPKSYTQTYGKNGIDVYKHKKNIKKKAAKTYLKKLTRVHRYWY